MMKNTGMNQLMQSPVAQGNNQQSMMNSQQLQMQQQQHPASMMSSPIMNPGGLIPQQQNTGNIAGQQGRMSHMQTQGNLDTHFSRNVQQQQAQSQASMMNAFPSQTIQIPNRPVHTGGMGYSVTSQGNNQQSDMINSADGIDKFLGGTE